MPLYVEVVIDLRFGGLSKEIIFTCSNNTNYLDVIVGCVILHVQKVLPFGVLLLEG
jgi:hypothetical protein